jgi:hypothetical protein
MTIVSPACSAVRTRMSSSAARPIGDATVVTNVLRLLIDSAALGDEFPRHDQLIQALALHYHFAAIHPFLDGNGRTARALEALMLQRAGLRQTLFIAMSNYYYEEKAKYLEALSQCGAAGHDLTPFLMFGLKGIEQQCTRLLGEIRRNVLKALFRNAMTELFGRLRSPRKRAIAERQVAILGLLLDSDQPLLVMDIFDRMETSYASLKNPVKALLRDVTYLVDLNAVTMKRKDEDYLLTINLDWATEITESEFFKQMKGMPRPKTSRFFPQ